MPSWSIGVVFSVIYGATMLYCITCVAVGRVTGARWPGLDLIMTKMREVGVVYEREKLLLGVVYTVLSILSFPMMCLFEIVRGGDIKWRIDVWHISWLTVSVGVLFVVRECPWLAIVPALKCVDLFQTMLWLMVFRKGSQGETRPLGHLFIIHYPQVFVTFACIFASLPTALGKPGFTFQQGEVDLDPLTALYFSVVSGVTLGFGDLVPAITVTGGQAAGTIVHVIVMIESALLLGLTAMFVPYFMQLAGTVRDP